MPCERYRDALTDAAAGEPAAPALAAHLGECRTCAGELAELRRLMAVADDELSALATAEPAPALPARIREAVVEAGPAPTWRWSFAWPLAAAVVVAVAALGVWRTAAGRAPAGPIVAQSAPPPSAKAGRACVDPDPVTRIEAKPTAPADASVSLASGRVASAMATRRASSVDLPAPARSTHRVEPEVLVPAGGQENLLRYVALVHREGLDAPVLAAVGQPSPDLAEPRPLELRPIEIAPLATAEDSET
jgi:hypothetical protein